MSGVRTIDGISCFTITDIPDDEAEPTSPAGKSIKTEAGRRTVPIHDMLIRCGFLDFVEEQRLRRSVRLFPELPRYQGRVTKEWSKAWGRFVDKHITAAPSKTFHSFRHLFIARLRPAGVDQNIIKTLAGHAINDVTLNYGVEDGCAFRVGILNKALQTFAIDDLDLSHLFRCRSAS